MDSQLSHTDLKRRHSDASSSDDEGILATKSQFRRGRSLRNSAGSFGNYIPPPSPNNNTGVLAHTDVVDFKSPRSRRLDSTSSSSSDDVAYIEPELPKDDYLETLDRKVTEVLNRRRLNTDSLCRNNSEKYGPLSLNYNRKKKHSPGAAHKVVTKTPSSSDNAFTTEGPAMSNNNNQSRPTSLVRFDEDDGGQESSQDDELPVNWTDDEGSEFEPTRSKDGAIETGPTLDTRFMIKRRSIGRRPVRTRHRQSVVSMQSVSNGASSEDNAGDTSFASNQRSCAPKEYDLSSDEDTEIASQAATSLTPRPEQNLATKTSTEV